VFDPLTPTQLAGVLSGVLRESAGWTRPLEPFQVGQLKSASSIGRFLAAELERGPATLREFREAVRATLDAAGRSGPDDTADVAALGDYLCELLAELRAAGGHDRLVADLRVLLRDLTNAEIDILLGATKD
jgi:hypothetical protein